MSDIFVSYASEDRERIMPLVRALEKTDWSVFWDRTIPTGKTWWEVIGAEVRDCRAMIVVWSKTSVKSDWVLEEAEEGKRRRILFPVLLDDVALPFGFGGIQAASLIEWGGRSEAPEFQKLLADLATVLGEPVVKKGIDKAGGEAGPRAGERRVPEAGKPKRAEKPKHYLPWLIGGAFVLMLAAVLYIVIVNHNDRAPKGRLFVNTNPPGAHVRILNSDQEYEPGMELAAGDYGLEVSAEGYGPQERWIGIAGNEDREIWVELEPLHSPMPPQGDIPAEPVPE